MILQNVSRTRTYVYNCFSISAFLDWNSTMIHFYCTVLARRLFTEDV